jgi:aspartyl/asparaginyl-tRNA synthetase
MDNVEQMLKYSVDHVVPGIGKLVGGNQWEERLEVLLEKMKGLDLDPECIVPQIIGKGGETIN